MRNVLVGCCKLSCKIEKLKIENIRNIAKTRREREREIENKKHRMGGKGKKVVRAINTIATCKEKK